MIKFYSTKGDFGCFSNFSRHAIKLKGKTWPTSEHYFQAQKFANTPYEEKVRKTPNPMEAAKMGRNRSIPLRKDWENVKDNIMREAIYAKFTQNKDLKEILLSTKDEEIIEHTVNDKYWADGGDGSGKNMLGIILMEIREIIKKENT